MEGVIDRLTEEFTQEEKDFVLMLLDQVTVKGTQGNSVQVAEMCHSIMKKLNA
jgi:hypothetical protein